MGLEISRKTKQRIAEAESIGNPAINVDRLVNDIINDIDINDLNDMSMKSFFESCVRPAVLSTLNANGYYSTEYGEGCYINYNNAPERIKKLIVYHFGDKIGKLGRRANELAKTIDPNQTEFKFDECNEYAGVCTIAEDDSSIFNELKNLKENAI